MVEQKGHHLHHPEMVNISMVIQARQYHRLSEPKTRLPRLCAACPNPPQ